MESTNKKGKFIVAVIGHENSAVGHLMKRKKKTIHENCFLLFTGSKYHGCRFRVTGKAVNQGDDKGMKIPCISIFEEQLKFLDILSQELKKHM